jgi:accessory gene regulator B
LTKIITKELNADDKRRVKICFGIESILSFIIKIILSLVVFISFGVLDLALISMISSSILRYSSGGVHCNTFLKCLIFSSILFSAIALFSKLIIMPNKVYVIISIILLIILLYKSPVHTKEKPLKNPKNKYKIKLISFVILLLYLISPLIFDVENEIKNVLLISSAFQVFSLTYLGMLFFTYINKFELSSRGGD